MTSTPSGTTGAGAAGSAGKVSEDMHYQYCLQQFLLSTMFHSIFQGGVAARSGPSSSAGGASGQADESASNTKSGLSFMKGVISNCALPMLLTDILIADILPVSFVPKYFGSEWSFAQVRGLEGKCICAFDRDNPRIIVSYTRSALQL